MKPLSEVAPGVSFIQIQVQAVWRGIGNSNKSTPTKKYKIITFLFITLTAFFIPQGLLVLVSFYNVWWEE